MTYVHYDPRLALYHVEVYDWMARTIRETGVPMRQAMIANKLRSATATVRLALIDLDRFGHIRFTRFKPQNTQLVDADRDLTTDPTKATPPPPTETPATQKMPWENG